jgi:hypothetical protein
MRPFVRSRGSVEQVGLASSYLVDLACPSFQKASHVEVARARICLSLLLGI